MKSYIRIFIVTVVLTIVSCGVLTASEKSRFVKRYKAFVEEFVEECKDYDAKDWEKAIERYEKEIAEYKRLLVDMTDEERQIINDLNAEVNAKVVKRKMKRAGREIEATWDEAIKTIKKLLD